MAGDEITQAELDEVISQAKDRLESQGQKIPAAGSQEYQAFQQNALAYLVQRAQFEQQAEKLDVVVTDKEVDERVARVLTQFFGGDRKKYEEALEKQGITDAQVRDELRATLVSEKVFEKVGDTAKVTAAEITAYYNAHPELYTQQPSRRVRHILVKSKTLADDLHGQLTDGADFAALAKEHSTDSSKDVGGALTIRKGETVPPFEKVALALKVNEISEPVKTQFGWHIIQALGPLSAPKPTPLASVQTDDPRHARRPEALRRGHEVARRPQAGVRGQDRVRVRLRTPGHVARRGLRPRPVEPRAGARRAPGAHRAAAPRVPVGRRPDGPHDRPPHRGGGVRGRGCRDGGRRREARRRAR